MIIDQTEYVRLHKTKGHLASDCSIESIANMTLSELCNGYDFFYVSTSTGKQIGKPTKNESEARVIFNQHINL